MKTRMLQLIAAALVALGTRMSAQIVAPDSTQTGGLPLDRGSLNQDYITIHLSVGALDIRFMPINEPIIRLLAPDGYKAISALVANQRSQIDSIARSRGVVHPGIVMVILNALNPNTRFDPRQFILILQNKRLQPIGVLPLSPNFANHQLGAREQATGLLIYQDPVLATEPASLQYLQITNTDWQLMLPRLSAERIRIIGAAKRDSGGGNTRRPR